MRNLLFKKVDYTVGKLLEDVAMGEIGLPELQRPFVWNAAQVRDLIDSMYRGYPIGTLLFWENALSDGVRTIGIESKQKVPRLLIVDGQQRLTALYAVMKGVPVVNNKYRQQRMYIAFHPLEEKFEVANSAVRQSPEWIDDISALWAPDFDPYTFVEEYCNRIADHKGQPLELLRRPVHRAIQQLIHLLNYPVTALEISANASEEQVADVFVRINSKGRSLRQADFILTLMSVFWDEGRKALEDFCRRSTRPSADKSPSPYNPYIHPQPDQLLRVAIAVAFRRARLEVVYSILRGKDLRTGEFSAERREEQFAKLHRAQEEVLHLQNWHDFLQVLKRAGYLHPSMISSGATLMYTYVLWLIGLRDFGLDKHRLRDLMARWYFMSTLVGRYTRSPETRMDQDLGLLRDKTSAAEFVEVLEREMAAVLTADFWSITLPNILTSASSRNTGQFAYYAALSILDAPVLYSTLKVRELLTPEIRARKSALERHHLFPRKYLIREGFANRYINQVANYALVEWHDNIDIRDKAPADYAPQYESRFTPDTIAEMYRYHALPERWYTMDYLSFLEERRRRMAAIVRMGFESLTQSSNHGYAKMPLY